MGASRMLCRRRANPKKLHKEMKELPHDPAPQRIFLFPNGGGVHALTVAYLPPAGAHVLPIQSLTKKIKVYNTVTLSMITLGEW